MKPKTKAILLKLSGELFSQHSKEKEIALHAIIKQIAELFTHCSLGIVVGAGNFFRGNIDGPAFKLQEATAHEIGMIATIMNGRILEALLNQENIATCLLSALVCPQIAKPLKQHTIDTYKTKHCLIFVGGTGNPFFTNDTNAVLRALQIGAKEVWKATKVDGIYDADPIKNPQATLLPSLTYQEAIKRKLDVMDRTALTLAEQHELTIRVFNVFKPNALHKAFEDPTFGSVVTK